jgi:zinc/manganese transport system substrate-binding protein
MITRRLALAGLLATPGLLATTTLTPLSGALAQARPKVVASFSILGDLVRQVGGDRIDVVTLVGPDGDAHVFEPAPADARRVAEAKLVVVNGLGFEGWLDRLVKASGYKGPVAVASEGIAAREVDEADHHEHAGHEAHEEHAHDEAGHDHDEAGHHAHDHGGLDPHAWQSVANARLYIRNIRDALIAADPEGRPVYEANAAAYTGTLDGLEAEVKAAVAKIPRDARRVITTHDAFGYFAAAYGIEFLAAQGVSSDSEPSARDVARLVRQIREDAVRAVFLENIADARLMQRIAEETRAKIGGTLYSDALSPPDGPAPTYVDMMRHNVREIGTALTS